MHIFRKEDDDIYLITNFKVMYTSLEKQKNLIKVSPTKKILLEVIVSWILPNSKFYLIVRNPFDRIRSFYKSKFLNAEKNRLYMIKNNSGNWQVSTEYFFPYLGLGTKTPPSLISETLMTTKFDDMISILPNVYMSDGHMLPQFLARKMKFKLGVNISVPIRFEKIFRIENHEDLKEISDKFELDLSTKHNNTDHLTGSDSWSQRSIETVRDIYKKDFDFFLYDKNPR